MNKKILVIIVGLLLIVGIGSASSLNVSQAQIIQLLNPLSCETVGEICGGIGGFACCLGMTCVLDGDYPDASGTCVSECLPNNTLIKLPDDPKIYVIKNCKKQWIRTAEQFQQRGYKWSDVEEVSSPVIQAYADYLQATANLMRAVGHQKVYRIVNGKRLWVPTISAFNSQGLKWDDIEDVNETAVEQYPQLKLARLTNSPMVYYLTEKGFKRHIPTIEAFNSYNYNWGDIVEVSSDIIDSYEDNTLIIMEGDYKVYSLVNGIRRWIKTNEAFNRFNYDKSKIEEVSRVELFSYTEEGYIE